MEFNSESETSSSKKSHSLVTSISNGGSISSSDVTANKILLLTGTLSPPTFESLTSSNLARIVSSN